MIQSPHCCCLNTMTIEAKLKWAEHHVSAHGKCLKNDRWVREERE